MAEDYGYKFMSLIGLLNPEDLVDGIHPNDK
jgi:hypothetical protein